MNKLYTICITLMLLLTIGTQAQTTADFENIITGTDSVRDGHLSTDRDAGGFMSGSVILRNRFDTSFGGFWSEGFVVSSFKDVKTDSLTPDYSMIYHSITGSGAENTANYAIGTQDAVLVLSDSETIVQGCYITNSNYAWLSMRYGDGIGKKFGSTDYFRLIIMGYRNGIVADSIAFPLAEGTNILDHWEWIDLNILGENDSLKFHLLSSDNGAMGMNTPAYFCIDQIKTKNVHSSIQTVASNTWKLFPNPTTGMMYISDGKPVHVNVSDMTGRTLITDDSDHVDLSNLNNGMYIITIVAYGQTSTQTIVLNK